MQIKQDVCGTLQKHFKYKAAPFSLQWPYDKCSHLANDYWVSVMGHTGLGPEAMTINMACPLGAQGSAEGGVQQGNGQLKYTLLNLLT